MRKTNTNILLNVKSSCEIDKKKKTLINRKLMTMGSYGNFESLNKHLDIPINAKINFPIIIIRIFILLVPIIFLFFFPFVFFTLLNNSINRDQLM